MEKKLKKQLEAAVFQFLETHPAKEFNKNLRRMVLDYLATGSRVGLPIHIDIFIKALYDLFELLDLAEKFQNAFSPTKNDQHK